MELKAEKGFPGPCPWIYQVERKGLIYSFTTAKTLSL